MSLIVQKYGGSSLSSAEFIKRIATNIGALKEKGNDVVVVLSAMGKATDELAELARKVSKNPDKREMDMLLSVGERVSISLLAMALQDLGYDAISFTGSQVGIITDNEHTRARILEIRADRLLAELKKNKIVIVAGFQGVSINKEITTLGRGGSDTTAVALGAALKADRVELMKDVDGIFKADPGIVNSPEIIRSITYKEMEDMASLDAGVIKAESVALAEYYGVKVGVGSSFTGQIGTIISDQSFTPELIKGISCEENMTSYNISGSDTPEFIRDLTSRNFQIYNFTFRNKSVSFYSSTGCDKDIYELLRKKAHLLVKKKEKLAMVSFIGEGIQAGSASLKEIFSIIETLIPDNLEVFYNNGRVSVITEKGDCKSLINQIYEKMQLNPKIKLN